MRYPLFFATALLVTAVAGAPADSRAQSPKSVDGRIVSLRCAAKLQRNGPGTEVTLNPSTDNLLGLIVGNKVRCFGPGEMEVLVPGGTRTIKASDGWVTIDAALAGQTNLEIAEQLHGFGLVGATRGNAADSRILWPAESSAVVPEHFVIRWKPVTQKIELSILSEAKDVTLWGPIEADGSKGSLKSDEVASALAAYKTKSSNPALILTVTFANASDWEEAHFSMLNGRQEQELNTQLDFWEKNTKGLALLLGRAYCFSRHKLFAEAADEYDSALVSAPESRYLLEEAIEANRLAGKPTRVKELQTRLESQPKETNP
jgi:hypothetical protein